MLKNSILYGGHHGGTRTAWCIAVQVVPDEFGQDAGFIILGKITKGRNRIFIFWDGWKQALTRACASDMSVPSNKHVDGNSPKLTWLMPKTSWILP